MGCRALKPATLQTWQLRDYLRLRFASRAILCKQSGCKIHNNMSSSSIGFGMEQKLFDNEILTGPSAASHGVSVAYTSAAAKTVVLVESPAKAKKIQIFLGPAYEVGRTLPMPQQPSALRFCSNSSLCPLETPLKRVQGSHISPVSTNCSYLESIL